MKPKFDQLQEQMTLKERASLLAGVDLWHTTPIERLGIPRFKVSEGVLNA